MTQGEPDAAVIEADFQAAVVMGWMEPVDRDDGQTAYKLTDKGTRHTERHVLGGAFKDGKWAPFPKEPCNCER